MAHIMTDSEITTKKNEIKERITVLTDLKKIFESETQTGETIREISKIDSAIEDLNLRLTNFRRIELERYNKKRRDKEGENEKEQRRLREQERRVQERREQERRVQERRELERREQEVRERERRYQERRDQENREIARRELERREQEVRERERRCRAPIGIILPMRGNFMAPIGMGFGHMVGGFPHPVSVGHHNSHLMEAIRPHTSTTFGLQRLIGPPINFRNN